MSEARNAREGADYLYVAADRLDQHDEIGRTEVAKQHLRNGAGYLDRAADQITSLERQVGELREALSDLVFACEGLEENSFIGGTFNRLRKARKALGER